MKLSSKPLKFIILVTLILMTSCGKKRPGGYGYGPTYLPQNVIQNLQAYLSHYACPQGRVPDITFSAAQYYQGSGNTTQIQGGLQPTAIGGSPSNTYVGVNLGTRDVIYITKMTAGGRVVGFNISLSLCRSITQPQSIYGGVGGYAPSSVSIPIIDVTRMPTVGGASPFIVMDPTNCGMGSVDQGTVVLNIPAYQVPGTNAIIPATQTYIAFTRASCL
ncbi:MAG: hypothetical protein ACHQYQ_11660 [Bacteriovoracales bacterium]